MTDGNDGTAAGGEPNPAAALQRACDQQNLYIAPNRSVFEYNSVCYSMKNLSVLVVVLLIAAMIPHAIARESNEGADDGSAVRDADRPVPSLYAQTGEDVKPLAIRAPLPKPREQMRMRIMNPEKSGSGWKEELNACQYLKGKEKNDCLKDLRQTVADVTDPESQIKSCWNEKKDDAQGRIACLRSLKMPAKPDQIDCTIYASTEAQASCQACLLKAGALNMHACLKELNACQATSSGSASEEASEKQCARQLKEDDDRHDQCPDASVNGTENRTCLREKFEIHVEECRNGNATNTTCLRNERPKLERYIKLQFREMLSVLDRLEAQGVLSAQDLAAARTYLEAKKAAFEAAETPQEKKAIVQDVKAKWETYRDALKIKVLQAHKNRAQAIAKRLENLQTVAGKLKAAGYDTVRLDAAIARGTTLMQKVQDAQTLPQLQIALRRAFVWLEYTHQLLIAIKEHKTLPNEPEEIPDPTATPQPSIIPNPTETPMPTLAVDATPSPMANASNDS